MRYKKTFRKYKMFNKTTFKTAKITEKIYIYKRNFNKQNKSCHFSVRKFKGRSFLEKRRKEFFF